MLSRPTRQVITHNDAPRPSTVRIAVVVKSIDGTVLGRTAGEFSKKSYLVSRHPHERKNGQS